MADESFFSDPELLKDFLTESGEIIENLDEDLVRLESTPEDLELLNKIFRGFHTLKGTSGFLGIDQMVEVTHKAEDVLNVLRKGERRVTAALMDIILHAVDVVKVLHHNLETGSSEPVDLSDIVKRLATALDSEQAPPAVPPPPPPEKKLGEILVEQNVITERDLESALKQQKKIGEILIKKKVVTQEKIDEALKRQDEGRRKVEDHESAQVIRIDVCRLDGLMNLVGELVLERNRLIQLNRTMQGHTAGEQFEEDLTKSTARLNFITTELQVAVLKTRMLPIERVFKKFPRMIRDIAREMGKEVDLVISGEETELDKSVVDELNDPLIHLLRNSVDHGIENPDVREAAQKPRRGTIRLEASHEGNYIIVRVADDGKGIDPDVVARKAKEKGLLTEDDVRAMSSREKMEVIFLPGFSTAEKVSNVSGRGVGMDVVKTNVTKLNGIIEVSSTPGAGTEMTLKLPLTLAIMQCLLVQVAMETYAIPLSSVMETVRIRRSDIRHVDRVKVLRLRDRILPIVSLHDVFGSDSTDGQDGAALLYVVVTAVADKRFGIAVDRLLGQEEIVIKSLGGYLGDVRGIAGATIMGDGRVTLIVDAARLLTLIR